MIGGSYGVEVGNRLSATGGDEVSTLAIHAVSQQRALAKRMAHNPSGRRDCGPPTLHEQSAGRCVVFAVDRIIGMKLGQAIGTKAYK
jgi:hypothetical protein